MQNKMKKIKLLLLLVMLISAAFSVKAQVVFSVEFNSEFGDTPNWSQQPEWTIYDEDGLETNLWIKPSWRVSYSWKCALSTSSFITPGQVDNWMILPKISIPENTPFIKWTAWSVDGALKDSYEVLVSTTDTAISSFTQIYNNDGENAYQTLRTLELTDYAGQDIYIGYRHNAYDKYILCIADIEVAGSQELDLELTSAYGIVEAIKVPDQLAMNDIVITNKGNINVISLDLNWTLNNGAVHTANFTDIDLEAYTGSISLSHPELPEINEPLNYKLKLWVSNPNGNPDEFNQNDTINLNICGISQTPEKHVIIEEGTYTTCGYCPDGAVILHNIIEANPNVIGVSIHHGDNDPMTIPDGDIVNSAYIMAYPRATIERKKFPQFDEVGVGRSAWASLADVRSQITVPASIEGFAQYDAITHEITVDLNAYFYGESVNEYRVNAYIIEDSVTGGPDYNQSNYYNNTPGHPMYGLGNPIVGYNHMHVLRAMLGGPWGTEGVIPVPTSDGSSYSHSYTYILPEEYDYDQVKVVVLIQKYSEELNDREIINSNVADWGNFEQEISLLEGFQFVSSNIDPGNPDMLVVLNELLGDNLSFVRNSQGVILRKIGPTWVNGIGDWIVDEGYLIKMNADDSFVIEGNVVSASTPIPVDLGFQFVSYFPEAAMDALTAFATIIGDDLDFIRDSEGGMLRKIGPTWVNGIGDAISGEGYLVKMFADGEIIYPAAAKSSGKEVVFPSHFNFEGGNPADPVFTIYVSGLNIGDEVAAYDGMVMVGSTVIVSENTLENALPIFSTLTSQKGYVNGNNIILKVWDDQLQSQVSSTYTFVNDYEEAYFENNYPSEDGEFSVINITKSASDKMDVEANVSIYPNPAKDNVNINASVVIEKIQLINISGQILLEQNTHEKQIDLNTTEVKPGIYFMKLFSNENVITRKLVIE